MISSFNNPYQKKILRYDIPKRGENSNPTSIASSVKWNEDILNLASAMKNTNLIGSNETSKLLSDTGLDFKNNYNDRNLVENEGITNERRISTDTNFFRGVDKRIQ